MDTPFTSFTPVSALLGGLLIGGAAVLLLAAIGRIAGISGIVGGALFERVSAWRWTFLIGLLLGTAVVAAWRGLPPPRSGFAPALLVLAGLLVGYGSSLGSGCTSGHGICGLARLSQRSLVATAVFVGVAIATTFAMRHVLA